MSTEPTVLVPAGRPVRAMVVGSGPWQVPLIEAFVTLECEVVSTGPNPDGVGHQVSHHAVTLDIRDIEGHIRAAREYGIDGVATDQNDAGVTTVAAVAEALGLPGIGTAMARSFTDKFSMRRMAERLAVPQPDHRLCRSVWELERFASGRDAVVVKARDAQGGRGSRVALCGSDLREAFDESVAVSRLPGVLAEERVDGTEYSVNGFMGPGAGARHRTLAIGRKTHFVEAPGLMERAVYAPMRGDPVLRRLIDINNRFIDGTGLPFGQTHAEYLVRDGVPLLVEVAARGGGSGTSSHIVPAVSGVDTVAALAAASIGSSVTAAATLKRGTFVVHRFVRFGVGRLLAVDGLDEARAMPGVILVEAVPPIGSDLHMGLRERHVNIIASGPAEGAVLASAQAALDCVRISLGAP